MDNLEQDGTYAGNDAIVAFARNNDVNVVIHQFNNPRFVIEGYQPMSGKNKELHLSYHNGEHYSSLRKINDPDTGPAYTFHSIEAVKKVTAFFVSSCSFFSNFWNLRGKRSQT